MPELLTSTAPGNTLIFTLPCPAACCPACRTSCPHSTANTRGAPCKANRAGSSSCNVIALPCKPSRASSSTRRNTSLTTKSCSPWPLSDSLASTSSDSTTASSSRVARRMRPSERCPLSLNAGSSDSMSVDILMIVSGLRSSWLASRVK